MSESKRIAGLLGSRGDKSFEIVRLNFLIGRAVSARFKAEGEDGVLKLKKELYSLKVRPSLEFLYEAKRVYEHIQSSNMLRVLKSQNKSLSWWWIANRCNIATPEGDTEEARLYWEAEINKVEEAWESVDYLSSHFGSMPSDVQQQFIGLITGAQQQQDADVPAVLPDGPYKFGHLADVQLSEMVTTGGRTVIDAETGKNERLLDSDRCLSFAVDKVIESGCWAAFIPGDLMDRCDPTSNETGFARDNISRLAKHMPVIVCTGNHELSQKPKDRTGLEFLKGRRNIFVIEDPTVLYQEGMAVSYEPSAEWAEKGSAKIFVLPYPKTDICADMGKLPLAELNQRASERLGLALNIFRSQMDPNVPNILLFHLSVEGAEGCENKIMMKFDPHIHPHDLAGFTYCAGGHIHIRQLIFGTDNAYYPSSTDRISFNEEGDPKGFIIGTVREGNGGADVEFVDTPAREYKTLGVEFFDQLGWKEMMDPRTIYRLKGVVSKEDYARYNRLIEESPVPILNAVTVASEVRVRDEHMTEELSSDEAVGRFLRTQEVTEDSVVRCMQMHELIIAGLDPLAAANGGKKDAVVEHADPQLLFA
jgi:DNA repair exonuclease SbcCD nuclease subunit